MELRMENAYHDDNTHLTKTALSVFCESPVEYYHQFITGKMQRRQQTEAMIDGTILHSLFLDDLAIDELIGVYPDSCLNKNGGLIGVNAKKHRASNPQSYWMKEQDRDRIRETYERLQDTAIGEAIAECSEYEQEMRAKVYGTLCKCKPDIAGDVGEYWMVYDLKFTDSIKQFGNTARKLKYWLQDAHYSAVIRELTGKQVVFKFIAAETVFPYRVAIRSYNPIKREMATKYHKSKIADLQACLASGEWRDRWDEDLPLSEWDCEAGEILFDDTTLDAMNESVEDVSELMEGMPF
jgi:hypothetical protein